MKIYSSASSIPSFSCFSFDKLTECLFSFKTRHGFTKKEFIQEAIEYYSKISKIPITSE